MLLCDCPICGRRELRGVRSVVAAAPRPGATPVLALACRTCGAVVDAATSTLVRFDAPADSSVDTTVDTTIAA